MALERLFRQAEPAQGSGNPATCMIANEQKWGRGARIDDTDGRRVPLRQ